MESQRPAERRGWDASGLRWGRWRGEVWSDGARPRTFLDGWVHCSVPDQQEERWGWIFEFVSRGFDL